MTDKTILPSQREDLQIAADKKAKDHNAAVVAMLREDFGRTFQTQHGKRVLAWIMERSGFGKVILSAENSGKLDRDKTLYSAMELNNYLAIRKHVPVDVLVQIEFGDTKPSGWIDPEAKPKRTTSKSKSKKKG